MRNKYIQIFLFIISVIFFFNCNYNLFNPFVSEIKNKTTDIITGSSSSVAFRIKGTNPGISSNVTVDSMNNIIITGRITGNADFNRSNLIDAGLPETTGVIHGNEDVFIGKYDKNGVYLWAKRLGGSLSDYGNNITIDHNNNVYIFGNISGDADLNGNGVIDPGLPETKTALYDLQDIFISKFDADGNFLWSKRFGSNGPEICGGITVDSSDNLILLGSTQTNADLNGDGVMSGIFPELQSFPYGSNDIFITKFDQNGTFLWTKKIGGSSVDEGRDIMVDSLDNIIIAGCVTDDADLDCDQIIGVYPETKSLINDQSDIFITKLDNNGNNIWNKRLGGVENDYTTCLSIDTLDDILITGHIINDADLNGDQVINAGNPETSTYTFMTDIFIIKFDNAGIYKWSKRLICSNFSQSSGITTDAGNDVYITGYINGNADLNADGIISGGIPETVTPTYGNYDIFISSFKSDGTASSSKRKGGSGYEDALSIISDSENNKIITGYVKDDADFNDDDDTVDGGIESSVSAFSNIYIYKFK
jgi:hypothetical protein